jgi:putative membrane protein
LNLIIHLHSFSSASETVWFEIFATASKTGRRTLEIDKKVLARNYRHFERVPVMNQNPFSQSDLDRIAQAVRTAESKTAGEIVPYFVNQSDDYSVARWRGGVACSSLAILASLTVQMMSTTWIPYGILELSGAVVGAFLLGILIVRMFPAFRRLMLGHAIMQRQVSHRASVAFLSEEVFKTRERTGVLIFMSFFERRVVILGDSGINSKVAQSDWDGIVQTIIKSVKQGKPAEGLVDAIRQCGELLQQHGVERRRDDTDELSDSLRIG